MFFVTEAQLLPQDTDTAFDIYDARECTAASPCLTIPAPPPGRCNEAETCRPALPPLQIPGGAGGRATFSGPATRPPPAAPNSRSKASKRTPRPRRSP